MNNLFLDLFLGIYRVFSLWPYIHFIWIIQQPFIDWLGFDAVFNNFSVIYGGQFTYSCISLFSHTSTPHNNLPKQLAAFPHRLSPLVEDECHIDFCQSSERKLAEPGLTAHVATDWATGARHNFLYIESSALVADSVVCKDSRQCLRCSKVHFRIVRGSMHIDVHLSIHQTFYQTRRRW